MAYLPIPPSPGRTRLAGFLALFTLIVILPRTVFSDCLYYGGKVDTPGEGYDVAIVGSYAFVADGTLGLAIVDISTPGFPEIVGSADTPGTASGVAVSGSYAYVADGISGLQVIDISNPLSPMIVANVNTAGSALGVAVSGSRVYVADGYIGLHVIDVTNPMTPSIMGSVDTPGEAQDLVVSGSYAYVADNWDRFTVVNVSNPASPTVAASVSTSVGFTYGVAVSGSTAYVAGSDGFRHINVSNPASPAAGGGLVRLVLNDVAISGSYGYVVGGRDLLQFNISDPTHPWQIGECGGGGIVVAGPYVWISGNSGLQVCTTRNAVLGQVDTPGEARDIFHSNGYAYVADYGSGLQVIDVSNPATPTIVGALDTPGSAQGVWISGQNAYVADGSSGLRIIDVSNPASPAPVGSFDTQGDAQAVTVVGPYAYVADGVYCLRVIDISNPVSPSEVGFALFQGNAGSIAVSGSYAYITAGVGGFWVLDISNPQSPVVVGHVDLNNAGDVFMSGTYAYMKGGGGLTAIDISSPTSPQLVATADTPWGAGGVAVSGPITYVPGGGRVTMFDVADPVTPVRLGYTSLPGVSGDDVVVSGSNVYVAGRAGGVFIFPIHCSDCSVSAEAGGPYMFCGTGCINLQGHLWGGASSGTWSTSGSGMFQPDDTTINAQYCPSAEDIAEGSVTLTLTTDDPPGDCGPVFDTTTYALAPPSLQYPNGGESLVAGSAVNVTWQNASGCVVDYAQIHYSADGGETWSLVADNVVGESYVWTAPIVPTENGLLRVVAFDDVGVMGDDSSDQPFSIQAASGIEPLPMTYHLYQNRPNPLENATQIAFDLPVEARVSLRVYDVSGRGVRILKEDAFPAGRHTLSWDARDASGHPVAAGIYFLRIEANQFTDTKLMQVRR